MEDVWIMDSSCSRHMTGHCKWLSSLNPVSTKEYITFGTMVKVKCWVLVLFCSLLSFP